MVGREAPLDSVACLVAQKPVRSATILLPTEEEDFAHQLGDQSTIRPTSSRLSRSVLPVVDPLTVISLSEDVLVSVTAPAAVHARSYWVGDRVAVR